MRHNDLPTPHAVLGGLAHSGINGNIQSSYEVFGFACCVLRRIANPVLRPTQTFPQPQSGLSRPDNAQWVPIGRG